MQKLRVSVVLASFLLSAPLFAQAPAPAPSRTLGELDLVTWSWRSIGPANMGGRVADVAIDEKDSSTWYAAFGTGGLFKTKNAGTTWHPIFDKQKVASVGAVAISPKSSKVVWAGTGEGNGRNSSSWGDGIYKSVDGGESFVNMGLRDSREIAHIVIDPKNDDVVYAAVLGHLWGPNEERGLYKTEDGGKSWKKVLKGEPDAGAVDVVIDPQNPSTVYAALWTRRRTAWSFAAGGPSDGIYKSVDAGATWKKLTEGLPAGAARIGVDVCRKNPKIVMAVVESDLGGTVGLSDVRSKSGGVFRSEDGGLHFTRVHDLAPRGFYFSKIRIDPNDDQRVWVLGFFIASSNDGGKTFLTSEAARRVHADDHVLAVDPNDSKRLVLGTDGGIYTSSDRGESWRHVDNIAAGEFYNVAFGMDSPYTLCGGLQDNGTWCGPSSTRRRGRLSEMDRKKTYGITNADWIDVHGGDGFWAGIDPTNPRILYAESQGGHLDRVDLTSGKRKSLQPRPKEGTPGFRFNWNAPFVISHHDPSVLYFGGNVLFKLTERGDKWEQISPDLTTADPSKMNTSGSNAENHCTIVALSESPKDRNVIWVGTDDGNVAVTKDGGKSWTQVGGAVPGVEKNLWVSRVEASRAEAGRAYVSFDGHRSEVLKPYVFVTEDFGATWKPIATNLPDGGPVKALREDPVNPDLLFVGTEFGIFASMNRGESWFSMKLNLPTVSVDDIQIHPREHDLILATHGRSLYVLDDISSLEALRPETLESAAFLFAPRPASEFYLQPIDNVFGSGHFTAKNPPYGAVIPYYIKDASRDEVTITVEDAKGKKIRELEATNRPGLSRAVWDLEREPASLPERMGGEGEGGQPRYVAAGEYTISLKYGERPPIKTKLKVEALPGVHAGEVGGE